MARGQRLDNRLCKLRVKKLRHRSLGRVNTALVLYSPRHQVVLYSPRHQVSLNSRNGG